MKRLLLPLVVTLASHTASNAESANDYFLKFNQAQKLIKGDFF